LKAYRAKKAPLLQRRHRVARLGFAREHENWENEQWANVLFADECRFCANSIAAEENKMNNLILLPLSPMVEGQRWSMVEYS